MKIFSRAVKITLCATAFVFLSCANGRREAILAVAESIAEEYPDSALNLLNTLPDARLTDFQRAKTILLTVTAKNKADMDITMDTVIFEAVDVFRKTGADGDLAKALLYAGRVRLGNNDHKQALKQYMEAEECALKTNDYALLGLIMCDMGWLNRMEHHYELSIDRYKKACLYFDKADKYRNLILSTTTIADCFLLWDKPDSAAYYYGKALSYSEKHGDWSSKTAILNNMGTMHRQYEEYDKALVALHQALESPTGCKDSLYVCLNLAITHHGLTNADSASFWLNRAVELLDSLENIGPNTYLSIYGLSATIEEERGNLKRAIEIKNKYIDLADSIYKVLAQNSLFEIQCRYQNEKLENEKQKLELNNRNKTIGGLILLAGCLSLVVLGSWNNVKRIASQKRLAETLLILENYNQMAEKQKQERKNEKNANPATSKYRMEVFLNKMQRYIQLSAKVNRLETEIDWDTNNTNVLNKIKAILYADTVKITCEILSKSMPEVYGRIKKTGIELSDTEISICCLLYIGFGNKDIAACLCISPNGIKSRCTDIRRKLGLPRGAAIGPFFR
jgi:ATP/maltotriose-dependent transcriptional regulator MalT